MDLNNWTKSVNESAFLQAIAVDPLDRTNYGVLADWLEEQDKDASGVRTLYDRFDELVAGAAENLERMWEMENYWYAHGQGEFLGSNNLHGRAAEVAMYYLQRRINAPEHLLTPIANALINHMLTPERVMFNVDLTTALRDRRRYLGGEIFEIEPQQVRNHYWDAANAAYPNMAPMPPGYESPYYHEDI